MWWSRARLQPRGLNSLHQRSLSLQAMAQVSLGHRSLNFTLSQMDSLFGQSFCQSAIFLSSVYLLVLAYILKYYFGYLIDIKLYFF